MIRKGVMLVVLLALMTQPLHAAESMTDAERQALLDHLERTKVKFLESIEGLSEQQWRWKASPERWSIAECADHIITAESFIRDLFSPAMSAPASAELLAAGTRKDELIMNSVVDRTKKFQAPEPLQPSGRFSTPVEAADAFVPERATTVELARSGDHRAHAMEHFVAGPLDTYGWILFLSSHTERHTLQIEEVKAAEEFPAGDI